MEAPDIIDKGELYIVTTRRLFGPNDVIPKTKGVVELKKNMLCQCKSIDFHSNNYLGSGYYAKLEFHNFFGDKSHLIVPVKVG